MNITIAILSTILTMMTFIYCVSICTFIHSIKKGWIKIEKPREEKPADNIIDELDEMYEQQKKENKFLQNQLNMALELYDEANSKLKKEDQV